MSCFSKISLLALLLTFASPAVTRAQQASPTKYKCMIQMTNYMGEGAYIVVSLVNPKGAYEKTLYVLGSDKKWYPDLKEWHKALAKKTPNISAITGASVSGGDRSVTMLDLDPTKIDKGYKLRFESAVEDNKYYAKDLEIPLTAEALSAKNEGTGYIRYVRFSAN
jgi:formylmethanofuran dehydrogenase subunit A